MPEYPREIEVERVTNLVRGFGWEVVKQEVVGDQLIMTMKKKYLTTEAPPEETPPT